MREMEDFDEGQGMMEFFQRCGMYEVELIDDFYFDGGGCG